MQIKNRQQLLVAASIAIVALFAADRLLFEPLVKVWHDRQGAIAGLRQQIAQGKSLVLRERSIRNRWSGMVRSTLTNDTSAAEQQLFNAITLWAQDSGVTVNAITPQWKHDNDDYITYECRVDATGDIYRLSRFLYSAEREPIALKMEAIDLAARDKDGQQLTLGLQFDGLVLNQQPK